jgi:predicted Zn-dependent protease
VYDDASLPSFGKRSLVGHYRYDDEGVPAARADLIERGILTGFLTSRAGIKRRHRSNGHGRSARHERPMSRMAVTVIESHDGLADEALFERLLEEIRRQGVPFGMRIVNADGGETATEGYNFQAFLGEINLLARVYANGKQEWIRGVNFVGTPLNAARSIVAAGARYEIDNAHCGAESGYVPVSTISPALVVSRLELQSKSEPSYAPYTYPIPWGR